MERVALKDGPNNLDIPASPYHFFPTIDIFFFESQTTMKHREINGVMMMAVVK
uniref:Uncharacterized protein n=1 Tax=Cucumis melo TaxID=3656 RepID=A0A9I9CPZ2_CUCME